MAVEAGMEQVEQQGKEGDKAIVEQAIGQAVAEVAAEDKEQVGDDGAEAVDVVVVLQAEGLLGEEEGQLEGCAVVAVDIQEGCDAVGAAEDIVQVALGQLPLVRFIGADAVVAGGGEGGQGKEGAEDKAGVAG